MRSATASIACRSATTPPWPRRAASNCGRIWQACSTIASTAGLGARLPSSTRLSMPSIFQLNSPSARAPTRRPLPLSVWNTRRIGRARSRSSGACCQCGTSRPRLSRSSSNSSRNTSRMSASISAASSKPPTTGIAACGSPVASTPVARPAAAAVISATTDCEAWSRSMWLTRPSWTWAGRRSGCAFIPEPSHCPVSPTAVTCRGASTASVSVSAPASTTSTTAAVASSAGVVSTDSADTGSKEIQPALAASGVGAVTVAGSIAGVSICRPGASSGSASGACGSGSGSGATRSASCSAATGSQAEAALAAGAITMAAAGAKPATAGSATATGSAGSAAGASSGSGQ